MAESAPICQAPNHMDDPERDLVTRWIDGMVRAGLAELRYLPGGDLEVRMATGEVFHLTQSSVLRLA